MGDEVEGETTGVTVGKEGVVEVWTAVGVTGGVVVVVGNEGLVVVGTLSVVVSSKGKPGINGGMKVNKSGVANRGVSGRL